MDIATQEKYRGIYYTQSVLFAFWSTLFIASIYSQRGYDDYYLNYTEVAALALSVGYGLIQWSRNKGLYDYIAKEVAPMKKWKFTIKKVLVCLGVAVMLGLLIARFFLPAHIVYCIQNILYVGAFLVPIYGVIARPATFMQQQA